MRKLRRDILKGRLAPCFRGLEQGGPASEECPICMLQYPALNRSRCCGQGICTECYAQVGEKYRAAAAEKQGGCPFCKTPGYRAIYEGCLSAKELAKREAELREVAEAQERQRLGELERQAEREREVAEMRRSSTEEAPAQETPGGPPEVAGHPGSAVPFGNGTGATAGGGVDSGDVGAFQASPEPGPRLLADDGQVSAVLAQYADFLPPELLSGELSSGGLGVDVEVEELMVHQAILASLRSQGAEGEAGGYSQEMEAALAASAAESAPPPAGPPPGSAPVSLIDVDPEGYTAPPAVDRESLRREAAARVIQGRVRELRAARSAEVGGGAAELCGPSPAQGEGPATKSLLEPVQETASEARVPEPLTAEELDARLMAAMAAGDRQMQCDCDAADATHREAVGAEIGGLEDWRMDGVGAEASGSAVSDAPRRRPELDLKISPEQLYHERYGDY